MDELELIDINPSYATFKYQDEWESTISLINLAPCLVSGVESTDVITEPFQIPSGLIDRIYLIESTAENEESLSQSAKLDAPTQSLTKAL